MITAYAYAFEAAKGKHIGTPYSRLDCQGFVEQVLKDAGAGSHNWRGSNHMWREALSWRGTIDECISRYGAIPPGAWLFKVKRDGGEIARGYHDNDGNAAHVGIYLGEACQDHPVEHSTTGGVQWGKWPDASRWTHVGFCKYLDFVSQNKAAAEADIKTVLQEAREVLASLDKIIKQLEA